MVEDISIESMGDEIVEAIAAAREQGVELYLCGVDHESQYVGLGAVMLSLSDVVRQVEPGKVLLEGATPNETYQDGKVTGEAFVLELEYSGPSKNGNKVSFRQSPNLWEVRDGVDEIGCLVTGIDMPEDEIEALQGKYEISNTRIVEIFNEIYHEAGQLCQKARMERESIPESDSLSFYYRNIESLRDLLINLNRVKPVQLDGTSPINVSSQNHDNILPIIVKFLEFNPQYESLRSYAQELDGIGEDLRQYDAERDTAIFNNLVEQSNGGERVLVCFGADHFNEEAPLIKLIEGAEIPYLKFLNVQSFCRGYDEIVAYRKTFQPAGFLQTG